MANRTKGAIRVFVYGTLKRMHYNHYLLESQSVTGTNYLGRCYVSGPFRMLDLGNFPGVQYVPDLIRTPSKIYGEVYEICHDTLMSLDILEGNGNFYTRQKVPTPYHNAWIYCLPWEKSLNERFPTIDKGVWHPTPEELAFIASGQEKQDPDAPLVLTA